MTRSRDRLTSVTCPRCSDTRNVRGSLSIGNLYVRIDGILYRDCPKCSGVGGATPPLLLDRAWLYRAYVVQVMSASEIAAHIGCAGMTVLRWLRKHEIPVRPPAEARALVDATRGGGRDFKRNRHMVTGGRQDVHSTPWDRDVSGVEVIRRSR